MSSRRNFFNKRNRGGKWQNRGPPRKKEYRHQDQHTEVEVGITEFINDLEGFSGIIKARFSDFQVNEIDLNGIVAKLTDTSMPKDFASKTIEVNIVPNTPLDKIPQEKWDAIKDLLNSENSETVTLEADNLNKEDRTAIHKCIKNYFGQKVVASTVMIEEKKYLQFKKYSKNSKEDRIDFQWPDDKGKYVHFLVYKEAIDTMDTCLNISDCLRMSPANFTYAGVKDKRAKTTQWFCVHKLDPCKLIRRTWPLRNIKIGNFTFKDEPLTLGQLQGNKFRIALRNVTANDDLINSSMNSVEERGFINYYGLQRFGNNKEVPTYEIGINLLLGKWKEAVQLILKPKVSDDPFIDVSKAKKIYFETGDATKALEVFDTNRNKCVEARLLEGLKKENENNFVNALENIPRNMRLLYIHSFQSLIWNNMVSKRLQLFGFQPVIGDFVLVNSTATNQTENIGSESDISENDEANDKEKEDIFKCKQEIKAITVDEVSNYTIYDIVLPLPGYDIKYPENMNQYYKEALEERGLTLEMTRQKVKTYTLCGSYRKMLERTKNLSWKILHYNDPTDNLIRSDFEELKGYPEPTDIKDGQYKALVVQFNLPSSCYATMVLREILKTDTSSSAQARMNDYHEAQKQSAVKKIIMETTGNDREEKSETIDMNQGGSLLSNAEKYEAFKNTIFKSIETPEKRKNDEGEESCSKKQKTESEEETRIVTETPQF